ncbi:MAG: DUF4114 domain-containing protein, partial [Leptolyngbyaceae bacterium]|nr:DUF4114 domain-containing protein [Leptolyngbyaceae bacterium]
MSEVYATPSEQEVHTNHVKALTATIVATYIPKIGQYLPGNTANQPALRQGNEYIQGNVISTVPKAVGDGWIYTWGAFDGQGDPTSIGVTFTAEVLTQAFTVNDTDPSDGLFPRSVNHLAMPDVFEAARVFDIAFPTKVIDKTPFNHMGFYANSKGHAPSMIYDKPHFDVHFFINSLAERELITGKPEDNNNLFNVPAPGYLHPDYIAPTLPGTDILATGDALQGIHWVDRNTPEFNGGQFEQTFIFGSYADQVNFWEPMVTQEFFKNLSASGQSMTQTFAIKQPSRFLKQSYYPLEYTISYNADFKEYTISLNKLILRLADFRAGETGFPPAIMDLRDRQGVVDVSFTVSREASYANSGGFYIVEDTTGKVRNSAGNLIAPGEAGYAQAALGRRVLNLSQNGTTAMGLEGGALFAPYLIANSTVERFLSENPNNDGISGRPIAYFAFKEANPDKIEHVRQIGIHTFAFEDLLGGGDLDFNDSIISGGAVVAPPASPTTQIATGSNPVIGTSSTDTLYASASSGNALYGQDGDDVLYASATGSTLNGENGVDILVAGAGNDVLAGGSGFDSFIFQKPFITTVNGTNVTQGGYGGNDIIVDFQTVAGVGDLIKLRNLDNGTGINVRDDGFGNTLITLQNRSNIDPTAGSSGTGGYVPITLQTIKVQGVSAIQLMTQGRIEVNGLLFNETTEGLVKAFGGYDYLIGGQAATFPTRPGGVAGNSIFGDPAFGAPGVLPENNLVTGSFVADTQVADLLQRIGDIVLKNTGLADAIQGLKIPGTDAVLDPIIKAQLEAEK